MTSKVEGEERSSEETEAAPPFFISALHHPDSKPPWGGSSTPRVRNNWASLLDASLRQIDRINHHRYVVNTCVYGLLMFLLGHVSDFVQ